MSKPLRCRLGLHSWSKQWDHEKEAVFKVCRLCQKRLGTGYPAGSLLS